jgi:hypothetical protein
VIFLPRVAGFSLFSWPMAVAWQGLGIPFLRVMMPAS